MKLIALITSLCFFVCANAQIEQSLDWGVTIQLDTLEHQIVKSPPRIVKVEPGSIAEASGLQTGYFLYEVNGVRAYLYPLHSIIETIRKVRAGQTAKLSRTDDGKNIKQIILKAKAHTVVADR